MSRIRPLIAVFFLLLTSCRPGVPFRGVFADPASGEAGITDAPSRPVPASADTADTAAVPPDRAAVDSALASAESGDTAALEALARRGGEGAWFALAAAAEKAGFADAARLARRESAKNDSHPFGTRSLVLLLNDDPEAIRRPLAALRRAAREAGGEEAAFDDKADLRAARISVLAARGREKALREEYESYAGRPADAPVLAAMLRHHPDDAALTAVAERYVLHCSDPAALEVLTGGGFPGAFAGTASLLEARIAYAGDEFDAALEGYGAWLAESAASGVACDLESVPPVFAEMAHSAAAVGREAEWVAILMEYAGLHGCAKSWGAAFQAGRLLYGLNEFRRAADAFAAAADSRPEGLDRDRAHWYLLRSLYRLPDLSTGEEIEVWSAVWSSWDRPGRFADQLEEFLYRRVRRGEWALLERLRRERGADWPPAVRSRCDLALAFAAYEGRITADAGFRPYLESAADAAPWEWPGLRAAGLLGRDLPDPDAAARDGAAAEETDEDTFVALYLDWGLGDIAADAVLENPGVFSADTVRRTAAALAVNEPRRSIRIAGTLWYREGFVPGRMDLKLRYPLPYGDLADRAAAAEGVPGDIFRGLIRTESAWDAAAVSRSGAMGLAQFMPATWEEWVRRMDYPEDADPFDADTNLALAAAYVDWLRDRDWTWGWTDVLASYNAGGGWVRTWRRQRHGYGEDLFGMSLPVEEPRSYVGKVLSAATLYGYLYRGEPPRSLHGEWGLPMPEVQ